MKAGEGNPGDAAISSETPPNVHAVLGAFPPPREAQLVLDLLERLGRHDAEETIQLTSADVPLVLALGKHLGWRYRALLRGVDRPNLGFLLAACGSAIVPILVALEQASEAGGVPYDPYDDALLESVRAAACRLADRGDAQAVGMVHAGLARPSASRWLRSACAEMSSPLPTVEVALMQEQQLELVLRHRRGPYPVAWLPVLLRLIETDDPRRAKLVTRLLRDAAEKNRVVVCSHVNAAWDRAPKGSVARKKLGLVKNKLRRDLPLVDRIATLHDHTAVDGPEAPDLIEF